MKKFTAVVAVVSSLGLSISSVCAQTTTESNDTSDMIVTANRFKQRDTSVLASTTVITRQEIEALQVNSALDVLKNLAGIEVVSYGGKAQDTSIFIRGTSAKHTLILLDGVRINSLTSGGSSIGLIPAFAIDRIEVIRGPRAAAYGSDALGGVISISTNDNFHADQEARLGYGTHNHSLLGWKSVGQINDSTKGELIASQEKSEGYKVVDSAADGAKHGYKAQTIVGHLQHSISDTLTTTVSGYKQISYYQYDSSGTKYRANEDAEVFAGKMKYAKGGLSSELNLSTYYNESKFGQDDDTDVKDILRQRHNTVSWLNGIMLDNISHVQFGFEYTQDHADRLGGYSSNYGLTEKHARSAFVTSSSDYHAMTLELSARYDKSSAYGEHSTWNTGLGYWLTDDMQMFASYGTGYKEPTFNDLYWPDSTYFSGNPDLKPETSKSREVGLRGKPSFFEWEVSLYRNDIKDMIEWAATNGKYMPSNVDNARIQGAELSLSFATGPIQHKLTADWKQATDESDGSQLANRAKHNYSWTMLYSRDKWHGSLDTHYVGKRISGSTWLDSYITVDTGVKYQATSQLSLGLKVDNLFNEHYATIYSSSYGYYHGDERTVFAQAGYQF